MIKKDNALLKRHSEIHIKIIQSIVLIIFAAFFLTGLLFGAFNFIHKAYSKSQAILVIIANVIGLVCLAIPLILRKVFGLHIIFVIVVLWETFVVCHSLGETFEFYYNFVGWDKALHLVSGVMQFLSFYGIAKSYCYSKNIAKSFAISLIFAICASLAVGCLWEMIEFFIDTFFGTNMQKFVPDKFFNGGDTFSELNGSIEDIATFYKSPEGYRYALMDSMLDCVNCLAGTVIGIIVLLITVRKKPDFLERSFIVKPRNRKAMNSINTAR